MTTSVYDKHHAAFRLVSAYVITDTHGNQLGNIAFKYPNDGAGRLTCYLHIHGTPMVSGTASGCGYDKAGAAFENACSKLRGSEYTCPATAKFHIVGSNMGGQDFDSAIRSMGYNCFRAL
jgi:hypothetical protein